MSGKPPAVPFHIRLLGPTGDRLNGMAWLRLLPNGDIVGNADPIYVESAQINHYQLFRSNGSLWVEAGLDPIWVTHGTLHVLGIRVDVSSRP